MRLVDADALITELNGIRYPGAPYVDAGIRIAIGKVCDAPTIEEQKTGKWISKGYGEYRCSSCREIVDLDEEILMSIKSFNYCPCCGSYNGR